MIVIKWIVYGFWGVIGFIFWIPLMTRTIASFSASVVLAMLSHGTIHQNKHALEYSIKFYPMGFSLIDKTLNNTQADVDESEYRSRSISVLGNGGIMRVGLEFLWSSIFWIITLATISRI